MGCRYMPPLFNADGSVFRTLFYHTITTSRRYQWLNGWLYTYSLSIVIIVTIIFLFKKKFIFEYLPIDRDGCTYVDVYWCIDTFCACIPDDKLVASLVQATYMSNAVLTTGSWSLLQRVMANVS